MMFKKPHSALTRFVVALLLAGCTTATPVPLTATNAALPPTATLTPIPPTNTTTATTTSTDTPATSTPTDTPVPPTPTSTHTGLPLPTNTPAPITVVATTAVPPTSVPPTSAPPPASGPTITGVSLVSREPGAITVSVSFAGLQPNQKYNVIAYSLDCPNGCARFGIIHSGLFNYFTPISSDWTVQLKIGVDSIYCQGGNTVTSNTLTVDLAIGVSLNADYSATFPLANTWCG